MTTKTKPDGLVHEGWVKQKEKRQNIRIHPYESSEVMGDLACRYAPVCLVPPALLDWIEIFREGNTEIPLLMKVLESIWPER